MSNVRSWVFRVLVLASAGLILYTWFQPWWTAYIVELDVYGVSVFPYGMEINMDNYSHWLAGADEVMPSWFTPFMWFYLGLCMVALLLGMFISDKKRVGLGKLTVSAPKALIGGVGLSYIVVVVSAVLVIAANAPDFYGAPLMGKIYVSMGSMQHSDVVTTLEFAYWLACGTGLFIAILGLLRNKIIGKIK